MRGKSKYKKARKYQNGLQPLPVKEPRTGGEMATAIGSAAAAGASVGAVAGPVGAAVGGVVAGGGMAISQAAGKKKEVLKKKETIDLNRQLSDAYTDGEGLRDEEFNSYVYSKGKKPDNDGMEGKVAEIHKEEVHGTPIYDQDGIVIKFKKKNVAPKASHAELQGKNNDALIPTPEGKGSKDLPKEVRDKEPLEDKDAIIHKDDAKFIDAANSGDREAQIELTKRIAEKPTDEDYGYEDDDMKKSTKRKYAQGKGVDTASDIANTAGIMSSMVGDYVRSQSPIDKPVRRTLDYNPMEYKRDTAKEEQGYIESRNAALSTMRGKGAPMGHANQYARSIQRGYDDSIGKMEAREDQVRRGIERDNTQHERQIDAGNLELLNNYDTIGRKAEDNAELFKQSAYKKLSDYSQVRRKEGYQKALDKKKMEMDEQTMAMLRTGKYKLEKDANGEWKPVYIGGK